MTNSQRRRAWAILAQVAEQMVEQDDWQKGKVRRVLPQASSACARTQDEPRRVVYLNGRPQTIYTRTSAPRTQVETVIWED